MTHCVECGTKLKEDDQFCPECGAALGGKPAKKTEESGSGIRTIFLIFAVLLLLSSVIYVIILMSLTNRRATLVEKPRVEENRCELKGQVQCLHSTIHVNAVVLTLYNNGRTHTTIEHVKVQDCPPVETSLALKAGEKSRVIVKCTLGGLAQFIEKDLTVLYMGDNGSPTKAAGTVTGIVQTGLKAAQ